jgi:hypothetical protein
VTALPNLFIVGAPKCGTTAWVEYLSTHPDIFFSAVKEPSYFCSDFNWCGYHDEAEYLKLFEASGSARIVGEASPRYLFSKVAARRIRDFNPNSKIIILLRNQEEYLPSQHNQALFMTQENIEDFETAWRLSGKRDSSNISRFCKEPKFLDYRASGMFAEQVERYFDEFPEEQIRVFHYRDWSRDPRQTYLEMLRFLGLEDDGRTKFPPVNEAKHRRSVWLSQFLLHPPPALRAVSRFLKRVGAGRVVRAADWVLNRNKRKGYRSEVSEALRDEIRQVYVEDNARLEGRIWKPPVAESGAQSDEALAAAGAGSPKG